MPDTSEKRSGTLPTQHSRDADMTQSSLFDLPEICTKICPKCKQDKPIIEFGRAARTKDGKNVYCKPCMQEYRKGWHENNKEEAKEAIKRWTEKNRERVREVQRNWHSANPERAAEKRQRSYQAGREKYLEYAKRVKLEKREFYTQLQRLREAKRMQAMPKWANREVMNAIYREARRLEKADGVKRHVDHVIPLVHPMVSGLHCEFNLRIISASENMAKKNSFYEFDDEQQEAA